MVNKINRSNKVIRNHIASISGAKNGLDQIAKKNINGPLSIGLVLSPSIVILFLASTGLNDPSGLWGALISFFCIIPAILSALLIVIGLVRKKSSSIGGNKVTATVPEKKINWPLLIGIVLLPSWLLIAYALYIIPIAPVWFPIVATYFVFTITACLSIPLLFIGWLRAIKGWLRAIKSKRDNL